MIIDFDLQRFAISNTASNTVVSGTTGDDSINNSGSNVTIDSDMGNDSIISYGNNVRIYSDMGNDSVHNDGSNVTIDTDMGNDTVYNHNSSNVLIDLGMENDRVINFSSRVSVFGDLGNDSIHMDINTENNFVDGGIGNDSIFSFSNYSTLQGDMGNDTIENYAQGYSNGSLVAEGVGKNVFIDGGDGNDYIKNSGANVTITGGAGNDFVSLSSAATNNLIIYNSGDGNDTIRGFNATSTLSIASSYSTSKSGNDIIVTVGNNKITLQSAATLSKVNIVSTNSKLIRGTSGADSITNTLSGATVQALDGDDTIENRGANSSILGGAGKDSIRNYSSNATARGGDGNDYVFSMGTNSTIFGDAGNDHMQINSNTSGILAEGGAGNDYIYSRGKKATMRGGDGDDTITSYKRGYSNGVLIDEDEGENSLLEGGKGGDRIYNESDNVTIAGGADNDLISLGADATNVLIKYTSGDGNDSIKGFNATSTLQIGDGTGSYSSQKSGSDIVVTVGEGKVTLVGVSSANIKGKKILPNSKLITGTSGADSINKSLNGAMINGLGGNDTITNYGSSVSIGGGDDNDFIDNRGSNVTIDGGEGSDTIRNDNFNGGANTVKVNGGAGNDFIISWGNKVTLNGGAGNDTLTNDKIGGGANTVSMDGGTGNDYIRNFGTNSTLLGGAGDDTIENFRDGYADGEKIFSDGGKKVTIEGGKGNDSIKNSNGSNVLFKYSDGDGNDVINGINATSTLQIGGGNGSYSLTESDNDIILTVGTGKITLEGAKGKNFTIQGKEVASTPKNIDNSTSNTLVTGTTLNDTITNSGGNVTINAQGGNDSITLLYRTTLESNKVTVDAGGGADTVLAQGYYVSVSGGAGKDSIRGHHNWGTLRGGDDNDTISGNHYGSKLYGDGGNDLISITTYWYNSISGGAGADTIAVEGGGEHSISGGTGADRISLGSAANSTLYYASGDGNDTVWGFNSTDFLSINGSYTRKKNGNDVIVTVGNDKITFKDAANLGTMTINNKTITIGDEEKQITQQDVIKTFMATLDKYGSSSAKTALDKAVQAISDYGSIDEAITAMVNDCKYSASGDDFLKNKCGIIIDSNANTNDTGAITGSDAGGTLKTAKSIIPESGTKQSLESNYTGYRVWYNDKDSGAIIRYTDVGNVTADKQHIMDCMYTWWASEALKLIEDSYGYSFNDDNAKYKTIYLQFVDNENYRAANGYYGNDQKLIVNLGCYYDLASNDYDVTSPNGQGYLDRTFAHELTHAVMRSKLENFGSLPQFIKEGLADLTHGSDDDRGSYMEGLAGDSEYLKSKLKVSDNSTGDNPTYAAGYMFLRWLAKQNATTNDLGEASAITTTQKKIPTGVSVKNSTMTVSTKFKGDKLNVGDYGANIAKVDASAFTKTIKIFGNAKNNTLLGGKGVDYLSGGAGNDKIAGNAGNDVLSGGTGNDSLSGGAGNDSLYSGTGTNTLTGGAGNDMFFYEGGKLLITDYAASDKIKISGDKISKSTVKNDDMIFTTSGGSISIKGGANKNITFIDKDDKTNLKVNKSPVTLGAAYRNADASSAKIAVKVTGNANDNSILGGAKTDSLYGGKGDDSVSGGAGNDKLYGNAGSDILKGGAGNDSLWGGAGNDKLYGQSGNDVFIYKPGEGTDTIFDYASGDMLKILKSNGNAGGTFTDSSFSSSKLTLSINGGGKVIFNGVSNGDKFNINGTTYTISGKKLK